MQKVFDAIEKEHSWQTKRVSFTHTAEVKTVTHVERRQTKEEVIPNLIITTKNKVSTKVALESPGRHGNGAALRKIKVDTLN